MGKNKKQGLIVIILIILSVYLFPSIVKAEGENYEAGFKFYTYDYETYETNTSAWKADFISGDLDGTLLTDEDTINPGDYIVVANYLKFKGTTADLVAFTMYYEIDLDKFEVVVLEEDEETGEEMTMQLDLRRKTTSGGGVFPAIWKSQESNVNLDTGLVSVNIITPSITKPSYYNNTNEDEQPFAFVILKLKESSSITPGPINFTYLNNNDSPTLGSKLKNEDDIDFDPVDIDLLSADVTVFGEPLTPSTLTGIEITNSLVPMPFPLNPLNDPFDSSVTDYSIIVPNKADNVSIMLTTSSDDTVIASTSGDLTKVEGGYRLDVSNLTATISEETMNTITFMVMDPAGEGESVTPKTYTIHITRIDNDTSFTLDLEGIAADKITYLPDTKTYVAVTTNETTKVTATPTNAEASITLKDNDTVEATTKNDDGTVTPGNLVGPTWNLSNGANTRTITVEGANCQSKHSSVPGIGCTVDNYTILLTQISTDARLSSLEVTSKDGAGNPTLGTLSPEFNFDDPEGTEYTYTYPEGTTTITLNGTRYVTTANITIGNGDYILSDTITSGTITVTAQDGETTRDYKVNFVKEVSTDSSLSSITVKTGDEVTTLFPTETNTFDPNDLIYNIVLPNNISRVKLEAVANKASSNVEGTGTFDIEGFETVSKVITVTAEDTTRTTSYTVNFTRSMSSNANIATIKINDDVIPVSSFDEDNTYTYDKNLKGDVTSVSIDATFEEPTARIDTITGDSPLMDGMNRITIVTKAQDNTPKTYTVLVNRLSNDTRITGLSITSDPRGSVNLDFNENVRTYIYTYDEDVETINVTPTLKDGQTLVSGAGDYDPSATSEVVITIKAEDDTIGYYNVIFTRQSSDETRLKSLTVLRRNETEAFRLTPVFSPDTTEYDLILPHNIRFVTLVAEAESDFASISENGRMEDVEVLQFDPENPVIRQFTVTAENNDTRTYLIRLSREKSADASLTNITVNGTTIETSDFNSSLEYRLPDVKSDVAFLDINSWSLHDEYILDNGHIESHGTVRVLNNNLVEGQDNTVIIEVTSQNEKVVKNYKLLVRRMSSYNKLDDLQIITTPAGKGYLEETFDPDTLTYTYKYDRSVNNLRINGIVDPETKAEVVSGNGDYPIPENNSATIEVGAEDSDAPKSTYTINFEQIIETDNTLRSLSVSNGETIFALSPEFNPDTLEYNVAVPGDVTSVTINAEKNNHYATDPTGLGVKTVNFGGNRFEISVTSEANETRTYVVNVNRPVSTNAKLSDLTIDGETIEDFDPDYGTYRVVVPYAKDSINIGATKTVDTSSISGDIEDQTLAVGDNTFQVVVTAEDTTTKGYYNLTVRRKSNDSTLDAITTSAGEITMVSDNVFRVDVPSGIDTITLSPVTTHPDATIASPSALTNISVLNSSVSFEVLAEDTADEYKSAYLVQINIVKKSNNFLSSLTTDIGRFDSPFVKTDEDYVITVDTDATKIYISATAEDPTADVIGDLQEHNLDYGDNYFAITVIAEDDSRKTYNLRVERPYKDITSLSFLNLNGTLIDEFANDKTSYTVTVPFETNEIILDAQALDLDATVSGGGIGTHEFTTERETYTFYVRSHAGTIVDYSVTVVRGINTNLNLTDLSVLNYPLDKEFDSGTSTYDIGDVLDSVTFLTVLAETTNTDAEIYYRLDENENTVSNVLALDDSVSLGAHTIVVGIRVGEEVNTYYINFTRIQSGLSRITSAKKLDGVTDVHEIDDLYIFNNRPNVSVSDYKREFANEYTELHVYGEDNVEIEESDNVATGMIMKLERSGVTLDQKSIIILAETTGDGVINVADAFRVIQHSLGNDLLTGAYLIAAETTDDDTVNVADAFRIIQHSLGNDPFEW